MDGEVVALCNKTAAQVTKQPGERVRGDCKAELVMGFVHAILDSVLIHLAPLRPELGVSFLRRAWLILSFTWVC